MRGTCLRVRKVSDNKGVNVNGQKLEYTEGIIRSRKSKRDGQ